MRVQPLPSSLFLLLLSTLSTAVAEPASDPTTPTKPGSSVDQRDEAESLIPQGLASENHAKSRIVYGAPVDGKDGKPHAGPFIETSAERGRKQAKEYLEEDNPSESDPDDHAPRVLPDGKVIPYYNDGVMDDKNRQGPKEGTTGTEGGVSEKSKEYQPGLEKTPDPPKAVPPLPHSEQQKMTEKDEKDDEESKKDGVLERPDDLPESPHSLHPPTPAGHSDQPLEPGESKKESSQTEPWDKPPTDSKGNEIIQPFHSFVLSLTMILFSEVGDKTFLVAALMAMRHPRMVVFSSAFAALITMTVLSAVLGHAVPTILPTSFTNILAAVLFFVFGAKMLWEAKNMAPDEGVGQEMKEVEMELEEKEYQQRRMSRRRSSISPYVLESGRAGTRKSRSSNHRLPSPDSISSSSSRSTSPSQGASFSNALVGVNNLLSLLLSPAWVQTFIMTFLGEWGDRSQIATIAMAAGQDYWWVTGGAIVGHGFCTAAAVIGGRAIAGRVSIRVVTLGGAIAFLVFGLIYLFEAIY